MIYSKYVPSTQKYIHTSLNNTLSILHLTIEYEELPYVNLDRYTPLFFDELDTWNIVFQYSSLQEKYQIDDELITLNTDKTSNTYGFIGSTSKGLTKGVYRIKFNIALYKPNKFDTYKNVSIILLSYNTTQDKPKICYERTYIPETETSVKKHITDSCFYKTMSYEFFVKSDGNEWIALNISSEKDVL